MSKIFISGGTGFVGSELIEKLHKTHEIYAFCRNVTDRKISLPKEVGIVWGDLADGHFLHKILKEINPEIVVHLAAPSSVAYGHKHVQETAEIIYIGTINLQKACEGLSNLEKFILASTSEVYGNQETFPIRENFSLLPNTPYSIAKVAADNYLHYCKESIGFPSVILRPFNSYGRTKNFSFVTESIIYQMLSQSQVILGDSTPIRDLLYIDDHVNGYIKAISTPYEKLEECRAINFCTGYGVTIKELAEKIQKYTDFKGEIVWNVKTRPTEISKLVGDWHNAFTYLGWRPQTSLDEGLVLTINKIRKVLNKCK